MTRTPAETLQTFIKRQDSPTLAAVLLELAESHDAVRERLTRLQLADRPDKLAVGFRKTLNGWRRSTRFLTGRDAREFGLELEAWLDQVACELAPKSPPAALELFQAFIESDHHFFERADDSDGAVGDAVRAACRHWLQAAAACESPPYEWPGRVVELFAADAYGARDELLRRADLLFDEAALRGLVSQFEARMEQAVAGSSSAGRPSSEVFRASSALSLLAQALRDPDVKVRAVLRYSPDANPMQRMDFVRAYLDADRPGDALAWLQGSWGFQEGARESLLAQALERLGRFDESLPIRQAAFERSLAVHDLQRWLEHLPEDSRAAALSRARSLALDHDDPTTAAALLLEIGDDEGAEAVLLAEPARIHGNDYGSLVPLAKLLLERELWRAETAVYRALLTGILDRALARAYGHAARYWARLREIADTGVDLSPLGPHTDFEAMIKSRHPRKTAFWARVKDQRQDEAEDDEG
jgi:tetratricopeptide (TPR) repeat protein